MLPSIHSPRLFDYFIIVSGDVPTLTDNGDTVRPQVVDRYPEKNHEDYPLPQDVEFFAQPEGCTVLSPLETLPKESVSFVFMLTDVKNNVKRFGVCVQFYRPILAKQKVKENVEKPVVAFMLTTFCIITHHTFFNSTKECIHAFKLMFMKQMGAAVNEKELFRNSIPWSFSFYPADFHPTGFDIEACTNLDIAPELKEWLVNLMNSPAPSTEGERLCLRLFNKCYVVSPIINFCYPDNTRLPFAEYCVHLPLELLGVEGTLEVLTCLLLEQRVVLTSENYSHLTTCVFALITLIYPLEYIYNVIPVLPVSMPGASTGEILRSPMPFLFGVPSTFFIVNKMEVPEDVVFVNIDTGKILRRTPMPTLPEPQGSEISQELRKCLQLLYSRRNPRECLPGGSRDLNTIDVEIRVAMIKFFMSTNVLGKFKQHLRIVKLFPRPITYLQKNAFLRNCSTGKPSLFLQRLSETSCLQAFGESEVCPLNTVVHRILSGNGDQTLIGDKLIWFSDQVEFVEHSICPAGNTLGIEMLPHTGTKSRSSSSLPDGEGGEGDNTKSVNIQGKTLMEIARLAVQPGVTVDTTHISDIALEPSDTSFHITPCNPLVDDFNPYRTGLGLPEDTPSYRIDLGDDTDNSRLTKPRSAHSSGYTSPATSNTSSPILQRRLLSDTRTRSNGEMTNTAPRSSSEDIAFISKIVNNVLDGVGIPWYQNKRLATVMQDENIRLLVANRILSGTTTKRQHRDVIQHEQISPEVFKGLASLLKHAVKGIDQVGDGVNTCGIGSIFTLMEVAYTRHMGAYVEVSKAMEQKKKKTSSTSSTAESPAISEIKQILNGCEELHHRPVSSQAAASTSSEKLGSPRDADWEPPSQATLNTPQPTLTPSVCPPTPDQEGEESQFQYPPSDKQTTLQRSPNPPGTPESGSPPTEDSTSIMTLATSLLASGAVPPDTDIHRKYLYEELLGKVRSAVWDREDTWEGMFYDAVHTEREILGMNRYPHEMQDRYTKHSKRGRQRIETDEDELLYGCIKNIVGFMVALEVEHKTIMKLISRLEGKTHIGLKFNPRIRLIKEHLPNLTKNQLTLKPLRSQLPRTSYLVHQGTTLSGETLLLEISAEAIFIRSPNNMAIKDRYFLEDVRRVSFSKKYKIMSLWVLTGAQQSPVTQIQFCSQKSAEAYNKIKDSFKRIKKTDSTVSKKDSSAEFEVQVFNNTEITVYLEITQDYVKLKFPTETNLIPVSQIFRVTRNKDSISLDALVANGQVKPYVFRTSQGSSICDRILTSFERMSLHKPKKHLRPGSRDNSVTSDEESSICLSSPEYQFMSSDDEEGI
ncbi:hypothetical protein ACHWQZ_G015437 [Mnemiopsis leidyi]